jgi:uncharacterized Tic20 family protein
MSVKRPISMLTTAIVSLVALLHTGRTFEVLALDEIERIPMMIDYQLILIAFSAAGMIGSMAFMIIAGADSLRRRRRRKYSCIQH